MSQYKQYPLLSHLRHPGTHSTLLEYYDICNNASVKIMFLYGFIYNLKLY